MQRPTFSSLFMVPLSRKKQRLLRPEKIPLLHGTRKSTIFHLIAIVLNECMPSSQLAVIVVDEEEEEVVVEKEATKIQLKFKLKLKK